MTTKASSCAAPPTAMMRPTTVGEKVSASPMRGNMAPIMPRAKDVAKTAIQAISMKASTRRGSTTGGGASLAS